MIQVAGNISSNIDDTKVLLDRQLAIEQRDSLPPRVKVGDGVTQFSSLPYLAPDTNIYQDDKIASNLSFTIHTSSAQYHFNSYSVSPDSFNGSSLGTSNSRWSALYLDSLNITSNSFLPTIRSKFNIGGLSKEVSSVYSNHLYVCSPDTTNASLQISSSDSGMGSNSLIQSTDYSFRVMGNGTGNGLTIGNYNGPQLTFNDGTGAPTMMYVINNTYFGPGDGYSNLVSLGRDSIRWIKVYTTQGVVQTSDRSSKHNIKYLESRSAKTLSNSVNSDYTTFDFIEFVKSLSPATFIYNKRVGDDTVELSESEALESDPSSIQLGLIADDIADNPLFKYIGTKSTVHKFNSDGEVVGNEEVLGLKPIPLAVLALTACKNLLSRVEALEKQN